MTLLVMAVSWSLLLLPLCNMVAPVLAQPQQDAAAVRQVSTQETLRAALMDQSVTRVEVTRAIFFDNQAWQGGIVHVNRSVKVTSPDSMALWPSLQVHGAWYNRFMHQYAPECTSSRAPP